ncbi:phenylalanine--tRNA ligase subunit beta [Ruania alkalisoli]|uniref:Phenylalanine--tRNA ligase beta subunit n=1 Tax=Ruania alkalisoli TaxID=2779775 RepID=A0A7M1SX94_9MICO|nr:phenylalanine--tRNA ligase subunit beta [Ruania alkalisoli]QOR72189.1 phenylalanine--tRNA ligase subunit beta [Ruania alkalisoli]
MPLIPLPWLREHVDVPAGTTAEQLAADLVRVGLEEETIHTSGVTGPLVVGRVLAVVPEEQKNGKTINWCLVDVGAEHAPDTAPEGADEAATGLAYHPRGIVCGAHNFGAGDSVVVALSGAVLPGDFAIASRKTYGHISDGMICSAKELGLGEDHDGIIVLDDPPAPGADALTLLGLAEEVLEINVTPDRGYCFSMRGVAREYAHSTGASFTDPGLVAPAGSASRPPEATVDGFAVEVSDEAPIHGTPGCDRFVARIVRGIDPAAPTPDWMATRLRQAGMRPISLTVDVTNYVMLDLGQPLHAYDLATLAAPIVVRRAQAGEKLTTLDDATRTLDAGDLLITDSPEGNGSRILGLAGVMGGADTEVSASTTDVLIEAAHFDPITVARTARRHKLPSEAAKRFERGVDPALPAVAAQRVVDLLIELAGGTADAAVTDLDRTTAPGPIALDASLPGRTAGVDYTSEAVAETLRSLGAEVVTEDSEQIGEQTSEAEASGRRARRAPRLKVTPPSWRSDLRVPADLTEEVIRLQGYDQVPSVLPSAPAGRGLTLRQRSRRRVADLLADVGLVQVLTYPFVAPGRRDELGLPAGDPRRRSVRLANPLSEAQPLLRTSVLETLVDAAVRNIGRGLTDLAVYEIGSVTHPAGGGDGHLPRSPLPALGERPSDSDLDAVRGAVPDQPLHLAAVLTGNLVPASVHTSARAADHADAIDLVHRVAEMLRVPLTVTADAERAPWHPGRCARFALTDGTVAGWAGELAPKVTQVLDLPARTVAMEVDLGLLLDAAPTEPTQFRAISTFPAAKEDIALVVSDDVAAADLLATVREGAGELAEEVRLFDSYRGESLGEGRVSLAFSLRLRAADRTLTAEDSVKVRDAVVALAGQRYGAELRS